MIISESLPVNSVSLANLSNEVIVLPESKKRNPGKSYLGSNRIDTDWNFPGTQA